MVLNSFYLAPVTVELKKGCGLYTVEPPIFLAPVRKDCVDVVIS